MPVCPVGTLVWLIAGRCCPERVWPSHAHRLNGAGRAPVGRIAEHGVLLPLSADKVSRRPTESRPSSRRSMMSRASCSSTPAAA